MQSKLALFSLLSFLFIASTSYARPAPEKYGHVVKGEGREAMLKNQNLTDTRNSGTNKKMRSDTKEKLVEDDVHEKLHVNKWDPMPRLARDSDDPLLKGKKTVDEFGPDFPIYDGPLLKGKKTVVDEPKP